MRLACLLLLSVSVEELDLCGEDRKLKKLLSDHEWLEGVVGADPLLPHLSFVSTMTDDSLPPTPTCSSVKTGASGHGLTKVTNMASERFRFNFNMCRSISSNFRLISSL